MGAIGRSENGVVVVGSEGEFVLVEILGGGSKGLAKLCVWDVVVIAGSNK